MPVALLLAVVLLIGASDARAADGVHPDASSPAGTEYAIPLDAARRDAAPRGGSPSSAGGGGAAADASTSRTTDVQSENGYGSSAVVPGAAPWGDGAGPRAGARAAPRSRGGEARAAQGTAAVRPPALASAGTVSGGGGDVVAAVLALLVTVAVGAFAGAVATSRDRPGRMQRPSAQ